jgi:hypothetical protein
MSSGYMDSPFDGKPVCHRKGRNILLLGRVLYRPSGPACLFGLVFVRLVACFLLVIVFHDADVFLHKTAGEFLHVRFFPEGKFLVGLQVLQGDGMCADDHRNVPVRFDELFELSNTRTGRITDD